ncbi:MAG: GNAT family N-acetyltransferase [Chthonomonadales bacterium]
MAPWMLRNGRRSDLPVLQQLWHQMMDLHRERDARFRFGADVDRDLKRHFLEAMASRQALVLVAEAEGAVVGYALGWLQNRRPIYPAGRYGFISDLFVLPQWRRRGIGRGLVAAILEWFAARDATDVELFVAHANPDARAFWAAMGFEPFLDLVRKPLRHEDGPSYN